MAAATTEPDQQQQQQQETSPTKSSTSSSLFIKSLISKRRTWVFLFTLVYAILFSSSWNILRSILSWYESNSSPSSFSGWPAIYAAVAAGAVLGLLAMAAAVAVAVPATLVTWITMVVLMTFCGKPRRAVVAEGGKLTAEIGGFVAKILIKEGNVVAAVCAVLGYFALVRRSREQIEFD